ncbi:MAG: hypothetical protein A2849_01400 [Candidatus Taylorbacteria bacterium RIFCSPHIGHO2_01_FULL_51_15]|uniref:Polymer-forming cytoskeletal protein n=1 Tax=Candidatus Taylorbacteria bacterium RIFCSPHIGHO2_01_FULL_51_15 TaxID=1802304 RepID=A0A1G2M928_9BACT|nr:MAG: hypothetical protein A2849_01400 [Candidatus Taylorbacteria bacterium RIFCSPHIGHO2_01_FULL_51_15]
MLKKTLLLGVLLLPALASAASVHFGDYFLKSGESAPDDVYAIGENPTFSGKVEGDAVSIGRTIFSQSDISGDVFFIGEEVHIEGAVGDDVRVIGGTVTVSGSVADDLVALGSKVIVNPEARIAGSLFVMGGEVEILGTVLGDVKALSDDFSLLGTVEGDLELWGRASFDEPSRIGGDFIYHAEGKGALPEGVVIAGKTVLDETPQKGFTFPIRGILGGLFSLQILMMLALGFALFFLARERTEEVLLDTLQCFWPRLLRGALIMIVMPLLVIVLIPTVVGIPLSLVLGALFFLLVAFSFIFAGLIVGAWSERFLFKRSPFPLSYRPVLLGVILLSLASLIPLVGPLFHGILLLTAAGSLGTVFFRALQIKR